MTFRTTFNIKPSETKITYSDSVMFLGSCFASYMGERMKLHKMPAIINPAGTIYNPESVLTTISNIISGKQAVADRLHNFNGTWISFDHHTGFSSDDPGKLLDKINECNEKALTFLKKASLLFITFGTARVYRLKETGATVSNCHKLPATCFYTELLSVESIADTWKQALDTLSAFNPGLKTVFTISPVRHWKDGAHQNQLSKSVLFLAIDRLLKHSTNPAYFPAYEIQMDDLRDYRFYAGDMLHPSEQAVDYIWEKFSETYFDKATAELQTQVRKITRATAHRTVAGREAENRIFALKILEQIKDITTKTSLIDLSSETDYFTALYNGTDPFPMRNGCRSA
ncbi:MAG: GSCFA domain-containing protein [Bacteroidales bacterium]|jgi:hypothetical protein|nr:GSCFA domain-containing protein [Bacteroidales bacterium]